MKILLALGNKLLSSALMEALTTCNCSNTGNVRVLVPKDGIPDEEFSQSDITLVDYFTLSRIPKECFERSKVILVDTGIDRETIASLFVVKNIKGVIDSHADISLLCKAIRVVHEGQVWIDNMTIKTLLTQNVSSKMINGIKLSERETSIIKLVGEGYKNKEIGSLLYISEQTVKTHLNRIFRKMNVTNRAELIGRMMDTNNAKNIMSPG